MTPKNIKPYFLHNSVADKKAHEIDINAEGLQIQPLPIWLRIPSALSKKLNFLNPKLEPEQVVRAASRRAGLKADVPSYVGEGLEVLCRSLRDEVNLHWFGKMNFWNMMVTGLAELFLVNHAFKTRPQLAEQKLIPPIFVIGMPRSGTTFLHRLLASHPDAGFMALWNLIFPSPRRLPTARLEAEVLFYPWKAVGRKYNIDSLHFVRPSLADECTFGMRLSMHSMIYWSLAPIQKYFLWLLEQDLIESYQLYRRVLLIQQERQPGKRLILKCPHHMGFLPALRKAFPEALIVQTHREPVEVVPSSCKLNLSLQGTSTTALDWPGTVQSTWRKMSTFAHRSVAFADSDIAEPIVHVDYRRLIKEPQKLAQEIYSKLGVIFNDEQKRNMANFISSNRQHKHGKNRYSLEQFGLTTDAVNQEFASYRERFSLA